MPLTREMEAGRRFEAVYAEAWPRVYRYVWLLVRHREDAEDLTAEAFHRAYVAWTHGRGPRGETLPWLFLIARRLVINRQRRRRIVAWVPFSSVPEMSEDDRLAQESAAWVFFGELSRALTARQHEALLLRFQFDLSDEAIGRIMGLSSSGVRALVFRAIETLRRRPEVVR